MSRRFREWQSAAESHYYNPGPEDESDSEGGEPDAEPPDWPQELAEQQEPQP